MVSALVGIGLLTQTACSDSAAIVESAEQHHGLAFDVTEAVLEVEETLDLRVYAVDEEGNFEEAVRLEALDWSSSDAEVLSAEPGRVTAESPGQAEVTAKDTEGHTAAASIEVMPRDEDEDDDDEGDEKQGGDPSFDDPIFTEDWSSGDFRQWDDGPSRSEWQVVNDPSMAYTGDHVLEVTINAGENGGYLGTFYPPGHSEIYVRARVRLDEGWEGMARFFNVRASDPDHPDWPWHALGGAGNCPSGDDRVRVGLIGWNGNPEPELRWYNYWHGMWTEPDGSTCWGRFGPAPGEANSTYTSGVPELPIDEWFTLEMHVVLNDPGQSNGYARMWLDGELRSSWEGESWTTSEDLLFNVFQFDLRAQADVTRRIYYDDIVILDGHPQDR